MVIVSLTIGLDRYKVSISSERGDNKMNTAARLHRQGQQTIVDLQRTVKSIWNTMCEADGIPSDSKFVVFSEETNGKYGVYYNRAIDELRQAIAEYQAGGYVGLRIRNGKVVTR